ncbi:MAG TPA: hypothetical protein ENH82_07690 [bacterium]|nr:hypothetical protein [bacterium]
MNGKTSTTGDIMNIEIIGLTDAQAIAFEDMLANWAVLSSAGASRWTAFYADGDGNFHPKIKIDGRKPKHQQVVDAKLFNRKVSIGEKQYENRFDSDYAIDFDTIAWALHKHNK